MLSSLFPPNFQTIHQAVTNFESMNYMAKYMVETEPVDAISEFQVKSLSVYRFDFGNFLLRHQDILLS